MKKNPVGVNEETLKTYLPTHRPKPSKPSVFNAMIISKALNFSLDEFRDEYFDFESLSNDSIYKKLREYYRLYQIIIKVFPTLKDSEYYNDVPILADFLEKIKSIEDKEAIQAIAKDFENHYFIHAGKITSNKDFKKDKKNYFIDNYMEAHRRYKNMDANEESAKKAEAEKEYNYLSNKETLKLYYIGKQINSYYDKGGAQNGVVAVRTQAEKDFSELKNYEVLFVLEESLNHEVRELQCRLREINS